MPFLTSLPPRLIHRVRDAAALVHDLAQLGLDLLCPCEEGHGQRLRDLGDPDAPLCTCLVPPELMGWDEPCPVHDDGSGQAERCIRPGCTEWITGASDYCSPGCETATRRAAEALEREGTLPPPLGYLVRLDPAVTR